MANLKKYVYYSKKNPYMKYYKNDSYCVSCEGHYIGKAGAQPHSSKIHNMTLDGRKLNQKKDKKIASEIKPDNSKIVPNENNSSSEDKSYHTTMKDADRIIALNLKINQLEKMGLMDHASKLRIKYNIFSKSFWEQNVAVTFDMIYMASHTGNKHMKY